MKPALRRGLSAAVILGAFVLGHFANSFVTFLQTFGGPRIFSDTRARMGTIELPHNAYRVYRATEGFVDADEFIAFSADRATIERFLNHFNVKIASLSEIGSIPERIIRHGPDSWKEQYRDPNWDLSRCTGLRVHETKSLTIVYARDQDRLFICDWGG